MIHEHDFLHCLSPSFQHKSNELVSTIRPKRSLVIINSAMPQLAFLVERLWPLFQFTLCADGGANRLYHSFSNSHLTSQREKYTPQFIVGDLDSLEDEVAEYYRANGTTIIHNSDQDSNDLDKTLQVLQQQIQSSSSSSNDRQSSSSVVDHEIIIIGAFGGRFDQEMANIHALFRWQHMFPRMILLDLPCSKYSHSVISNNDPSVERNSKDSDCMGSVTSLLSANNSQHILRLIRDNHVTEGVVIGLLPIGGRVREITTSGLLWNLNKQSLAFGELISSSNRFDDTHRSEEDNASIVRIETSDDVVWTCSFRLH